MVRITAFLSLFVVCSSFGFSQTSSKLEIKEGSVLTYKIKDGTTAYNFIVTLDTKEYDEVKFQWKTSEANPRSGTVTTAPDFDEMDVHHLLVTSFKNGEEELEFDQARLFLPLSVISRIEVYGDEEIYFDINGNDAWSKAAKGMLKGNNKLTYNGKSVNSIYTELLNKPNNAFVGYTSFETSGDYLVSFYSDKKITMQLASVTTAVKKASKAISPKPLPGEKASVLTKMDPAKFAIVKTKYPTLAKLETFDPTKGGTIAKPFTETYAYRLSSNAKNPPSLVDCFICDLRILFNQGEKFSSQTGVINENLTNKSLPATLVTKLLQIYLKAEVNQTPGYRPWSHNQFVKSLTKTERSKLAADVEQYVKIYGFLDAD